MQQPPIQDHFENAAPTWDTPERQQLISGYAKNIRSHLTTQSNLRVLDVGCGTGLLSGNFLGNGNEILGIDTSEDMLKIFRSKFDKRSEEIRGLLFNLENEDLKEGLFDLIVSSMAFHHLKNPGLMLQKLRNMLSSNGTIAIIDLDQESGAFHPDPANMGVHHFGFSRQTIEGWAKEAGFPKMEYELIHTIEKDSGKFPVFLAVFKTPNNVSTQPKTGK